MSAEPLLWEGVLGMTCPGPAGNGGCVREMFHGGDHLPVIAEPAEAEILDGVRRLRESHDALLTIVRRIAALRDCDEEPGACESQSGPYCGAHGDNYLLADEIAAARAAIKKAEGSK